MRILQLLLGLAVGAILLVPAPAVADDSFFDEGRAKAGLEKIFGKAGHPSRVLSVDIRANRLVVEVQAVDDPRHVDTYIDRIATYGFERWFKPEAVSGPFPVELNLINPDLDANLFELKPEDLAIVARLAGAAVKRAELEDTAGIDRMELRRRLSLLPQPRSGEPRWSIEVTSGRERATVYADIAGEITGANLDGTRRARTTDYLAGGKDLAEVVVMTEQAMGNDPVVKTIIIYDRYLMIDALRPGDGERYGSYSAGINGVFRREDNISLPGQRPAARFALADVDWALLSKLQKTARDRLDLPGGRLPFVEISRPGSAVGDPVITWEINVESAGDSSVSGRVTFDNKGDVLATQYPRGRGPKPDMLQAAGYQPAFDALTKAIGAHAAVVTLEFRPDSLLVTTKDPQKPDALVVLEYRGESVARSIMPPLDWPTFGPDWFFDLSQAAPIAAHWAEWQQDALGRLGLADGEVERVTISKQRLEMPRNDRLLVEIRAEAGKRDGRVIYDLNGKVVEIIRP